MLLALRSLYERLSLIAEAGTFSVTGGNVNLTYTQLPSRQYALGGLYPFYLDDRDIRQAAVFGQYVDQTTQGILQSYTLTASAGTFTLSGAAAGVLRKFTLTASSGSFTFTGNATALLSARKLPAAAGSFSFTGGSAAIYSGLSFGAQAGTFALTGAPQRFGQRELRRFRAARLRLREVRLVLQRGGRLLLVPELSFSQARPLPLPELIAYRLVRERFRSRAPMQD
jgi:hypothetical protein